MLVERREVQRRRVLGLPPPSSPGPDSGPDSGPSLGPSAVVDQWLVSRLEQGLALDPNDLNDDKNNDNDNDGNDEDDDGRLGMLSYHEDDEDEDEDEDREDGLSYRDVYGEQVEVFTTDIPGRPSRHRHHRRMGKGEGKDKGLNSDEGLVKGSGKEDEESINPFIKPSIKLSIKPTHQTNLLPSPPTTFPSIRRSVLPLGCLNLLMMTKKMTSDLSIFMIRHGVVLMKWGW